MYILAMHLNEQSTYQMAWCKANTELLVFNMAAWSASTLGRHRLPQRPSISPCQPPGSFSSSTAPRVPARQAPSSKSTPTRGRAMWRNRFRSQTPVEPRTPTAAEIYRSGRQRPAAQAPARRTRRSMRSPPGPRSASPSPTPTPLSRETLSRQHLSDPMGRRPGGTQLTHTS
jgi:hypothetical protein